MWCVNMCVWVNEIFTLIYFHLYSLSFWRPETFFIHDFSTRCFTHLFRPEHFTVIALFLGNIRPQMSFGIGARAYRIQETGKSVQASMLVEMTGHEVQWRSHCMEWRFSHKDSSSLEHTAHATARSPSWRWEDGFWWSFVRSPQNRIEAGRVWSNKESDRYECEVFVLADGWYRWIRMEKDWGWSRIDRQ